MTKGIVAALVFAAFTVASGPSAHAAQLGTSTLAAKPASAFTGSLLQETKIRVRKRWRRPGRVVIVRPWRPWKHRPHYGAIIAGITIGTIIAVAAANAAPPPPSPDLCWYWSNRERTHGYWDYCG